MTLSLFISTGILVFGLQSMVLIGLLLQKRSLHNGYQWLALTLFFYLLSTVNYAVFYFIDTMGFGAWGAGLQIELLYGFGPSLYCFTKSITQPSFQFKRSHFWHFVPVSLEFIYYRTTWFQTGASVLSQPPTTLSEWLFHGVQWGGIVSVFIYLAWVHRRLCAYQTALKAQYSNLENRTVQWFATPVMVYTLFWCVWIGIRLTDLLFFEESLREYYFDVGFLLLAGVTCWMGTVGYIKAAVASQQPAPHKPITSTTAYDATLLSEVASALKNCMESDHVYLDPNLTLSQLATHLNYPAKAISISLNTVLKASFHEFVNQYRVEVFMKHVKENKFPNLSLLGIAFESGFGSKSSFNLVFKKATGMTPKQFQQKLVERKS